MVYLTGVRSRIALSLGQGLWTVHPICLLCGVDGGERVVAVA